LIATTFMLIGIILSKDDMIPNVSISLSTIRLIGWIGLNVILAPLLLQIAQSIPCEGGGMGCAYASLILPLFYIALSNIGFVIFLAIIRRWWIAIPMVAAFAVSIVVYALK
ncbi:MAG TPA: hypothetical protein VJL59_18700, partial [Anaerolineales bacterium]|nr:hypothetical protein [Anaerolineales bacterium]